MAERKHYSYHRKKEMSTTAKLLTLATAGAIGYFVLPEVIAHAGDVFGSHSSPLGTGYPTSGSGETPPPTSGSGGTGLTSSEISQLNSLVHFNPSIDQATRTQILHAIDTSPQSIAKAVIADRPNIEVAPYPPGNGPYAYFDDTNNNNEVVVYAGTGYEAEATEHELAHVWDYMNGITSDPQLQQLALQDMAAHPEAVSYLVNSGYLADRPVLSNHVAYGDLFAGAAVNIAGDSQSDIPGYIAYYFPHFYAYLKKEELGSGQAGTGFSDIQQLGSNHHSLSYV